MCEYCKNNHNDGRFWKTGDYILPATIEFIEVDYGYRRMQVIFCPNCGRRVRDEYGWPIDEEGKRLEEDVIFYEPKTTL